MSTVLSSPKLFDASWFDGQTAIAHAVRVEVFNGSLCASTAYGVQIVSVRFQQMRVSEPTRYGPRFVEIPERGTLEISDAVAFNEALGETGHAPALVSRLQAHWPFSVAAVGFLVALLVFGYLEGVPALARWVTFNLPSNIESRLGAGVLAELDNQMLDASRLSPERRSTLKTRFISYARHVTPDVAVTLEFRSQPGPSGINAFALPGGTIVLLDGLVEKAGNDEQILGVLGHELGHVVQKHSMRQLLQSISVALAAGAIWGDFSSVAANAPALIGALSYSRDFEREADEFARTYLIANRVSPQALADFFAAMAAMEGRRGQTPAFLSSHPSTEERIDRLKDRR